MNILLHTCKDDTITDVLYCPPITWKQFFSSNDSIIRKIDKELEDVKVYPPKCNVFKSFFYVPLNNIKVVIIGQDPYHDVGSATGIAFETVNMNPSLQNIFKVLSKTVEGFKIPNNGILTKWVLQGVFMYNTALTVLHSTPGSHTMLWRFFTEELMKYLNNNLKGVVYMCWGGHAQNIVRKYIDGSVNYILSTTHPSPLSAYRGFLDSNHFNEANIYLKSKGKEEINWNL